LLAKQKEVDFDFSEVIQGNEEDIHYVRPFNTWINEVRKSTNQLIYLIEREEKYPVTEGNFHDFWQSICVNVSKSEYDRFAIELCKMTIELAFVLSILRSDRDYWVTKLGRIGWKGDEQILNSAFEEIVQQSTESDGGLEYISPTSETEKFDTYFEYDDLGFARANEKYVVWIERMRESVNNKTQYYVNEYGSN